MGLESEADEMSTVDVQADTETSAIIEFERSATDWLLVAFFALGAVAIGYFISNGGLMVGFCGCLLFWAAYRRAIKVPERKIGLAFDCEGLLVPTVFNQKLPWSAIAGFGFETESESGRMLCVEVVELKSYGPKSKLSLLAWPGFPDGFYLSLDSVTCSETEIEAAFRRFAPQVRKI